ncbi:MAG: nucleoside hydrolase [Spirochaetales bacterium]|nr:nucleoside hydrolase [Spirochaetales bacterium]
MTSIIIDSDMALGCRNADVDDAIAILVALSEKELEVIGISPSAGNVPGDYSGPNIDRLLRIIGRESVPHARRASAFVSEDHWIEEGRWKALGLAEQDPALLEGERSVDFLIRRLSEASEPVVLVNIGPLTNLALALKVEPRIERKIKALYMMGGTWFMPGVGGKDKEFNILADIDAAASVFLSNLKIVIFPLDVTKKRKIYPEDLALWKDSSSAFSRYLYNECTAFMKARAKRDGYPDPHAFFHDVLPVLAIDHPEWFSLTPCSVHIDTIGERTRGKMVVDTKLRGRREHRHLIATDVRENEVLKYVISRIDECYKDAVI